MFFDDNYTDMKLAVKKDYTVAYVTDDLESPEAPAAGSTVTVTITAVKDTEGQYSGNYEGEVTETYRIVDSKENTNISKAKIVVNPNLKGAAQSCAYTGEAIKPGSGDVGQPDLLITIGTGLFL